LVGRKGEGKGGVAVTSRGESALLTVPEKRKRIGLQGLSNNKGEEEPISNNGSKKGDLQHREKKTPGLHRGRKRGKVTWTRNGGGKRTYYNLGGSA